MPEKPGHATRGNHCSNYATTTTQCKNEPGQKIHENDDNVNNKKRYQKIAAKSAEHELKIANN
jgi:hypothetical protein